MSNPVTFIPKAKETVAVEFRPPDEDRGESAGICLPGIDYAPPRNQHCKSFECPLCIETFKRFSHLERHLLFMHPLRPKIMKLVKERYGIPDLKSDEAVQQSKNSNIKCHCRPRPSKALPRVTRSSQTANTFQSIGTEMTSKALHFPPKLRHKAFIYASHDYFNERREDSRTKTKLQQ